MATFRIEAVIEFKDEARAPFIGMIDVRAVSDKHALSKASERADSWPICTDEADKIMRRTFTVQS